GAGKVPWVTPLLVGGSLGDPTAPRAHGSKRALSFLFFHPSGQITAPVSWGGGSCLVTLPCCWAVCMSGGGGGCPAGAAGGCCHPVGTGGRTCRPACAQGWHPFPPLQPPLALPLHCAQGPGVPPVPGGLGVPGWTRRFPAQVASPPSSSWKGCRSPAPAGSFCPLAVAPGPRPLQQAQGLPLGATPRLCCLPWEGLPSTSPATPRPSAPRSSSATGTCHGLPHSCLQALQATMGSLKPQILEPRDGTRLSAGSRHPAPLLAATAE
ncbi:unnamed protein product, partial [Bubo scandiacus]